MSATSLTKIPGISLISGVPCIAPKFLKEIPGYNVRDAFNPDADQDDKELVASIAANGFQSDKPVTVRIVGNDVYVVAGHRRFAAVQAAIKAGAKIPGIAIIPEGKGTDGKPRDMAEMALDLIVSNSGKRLSPPESGAAILRMRECGMKDTDIAQRTGFSDKWVRELAKLARADVRLRALVKAGVVAPTLALETAAKHGAKAADVIEAAAKKGTGANAGKATGKTIEAVTGVPAKNARVDRLKENGAKHDAVAVKVGASVTGAVKPLGLPSLSRGAVMPHKVLSGPFAVGKDMDDCMVYEGNGSILGEMPNAEKARAVVALLNQAWPTFAGRSAEPVAAEPAKVAPVKAEPVKAAPVKAEPIKAAPVKAEPAKVAPAKGKATVATVIAGKAGAKAQPVMRKSRGH